MRPARPGNGSAQAGELAQRWATVMLAYRSKDHDGAVAACQVILASEPGHAPAWNMLGVLALARQQGSEAYAALAKACAHDPGNASYQNNFGIAARACALPDEAQSAYRRAIALQAAYPEAWFNLGNVLRDSGNHDGAEQAFRQATVVKPDYADAWNNLGNMLRTLARPADAADAFRTSLQLRDDPQTRSNLAFALRETGQEVTALALQRATVLAEPGNSSLHFNLANALCEAGLGDEALAHYRHALALKPDYTAAANNLGTLWLNRGEHLAAFECFQRALFTEPDNTDFLANRACAERALHYYGRAVATLRRAVALQPGHAAGYFNLGNALREWQRYDMDAVVEAGEIASCYRQAIALEPDEATAWSGLAGHYSDTGEDEASIEASQRAIALAPDNWQYQLSLAQRLHSSGDVDAARAVFHSAQALVDHAGARIRCATLFPAVMASEAAVADSRAQLVVDLGALQALPFSIKDPVNDIAVAPMFYLAYHGQGNADLMRSYTDTIRAACPSIEYVAPHCSAPATEAGQQSGKIRIGFASKFMQSHTIGRFFRGILKNLDRDRFEIFAFMAPATQDVVTKWIAGHVDHFEVLPQGLADARARIAGHQLDILVYTDLGMEPLTYYLAFARLAPVQCVLYGHPDTTGIPNIDYFISSGACEPDDADNHYTEKLIRLDPSATYTYYYRPDNRAQHKTRAELGLPEAVRLYTCAQSMFKIHPEMDPVFDAILERDPQAMLLLFDDVSMRRIALFKQRLQQRMRHFDRVLFLPRVQLPDFLQVLHLSDALLDSFHFCGGNTSFDSFAAEAPVVTLPGAFMRGRQTMGLYRRMGFTDLIATDKADYVDKAVRLANDPAFRHAMRRELAAKAPLIFEDAGMVRAMEQFFISVHKAPADSLLTRT